MSYRTKQSWYHVRPGLREILSEAGVSGVRFYQTAQISHATLQAVCKGAPFVRGEIRQKVIDGVVLTCGPQFGARAEALWDQIPKAEIRINGDSDVQARLRDLARKHGLTPFEYVAQLVVGPRDPLDVMALKTGGRRRS